MLVQSVPLIIGQTFLNGTNVTMVLRNNQIRIFDKFLAALPNVEALSPRKIGLWSKEAVVIPPHTVRFISVTNETNYDGDVYIEGVSCRLPGQEYKVPTCVTTTREGITSVRNVAEKELRWSKGHLITRSSPCQLQVNIENKVSTYLINACDLKPFEIRDLGPQI